MKKNRSLSRCYIASYLLWVFGVVLAALMFLKISVGLMIALIVVAVIILGGIIASHVLYNKQKMLLFLIFSFASHGLATIFILAAMIFELVLNAQGQGALYAMIMLIGCSVIYALVDVFLTLNNLKTIKKLRGETVLE